MLHLVLRALLLISFFLGEPPVEAASVHASDGIDVAPTLTLPAGEPRRQIKLEVPNLVAVRLPQARPVRITFERIEVQRPQPFRLCAHPAASRTHVPRRRIPRMRDDVGDH